MTARLFLWACPTQSYRIRAMIDSQPPWDYVPPNPFGFVTLVIVSQKPLTFENPDVKFSVSLYGKKRPICLI